MRRLPAPASAALLLLVSCGTPGKATPAAPEVPPAAPTPVGPAGPRVVATDLTSVGLDPAALDRSADPCQDFYQFACGGWLATTEIPADESRWGRSFSEINKRNEEELRALLEEAARTGADPLMKQIGDFYAACTDEATVEAAGTTGIQPLLDKARAVRDKATLATAITELHRHGIDVVFEFDGEQDFKDPTQVVGFLDQAGLGLPDKDLYLATDERSKGIRAAYGAHVERMFRLLGQPAARARRAAADVLAVETALAKVSKSRVERRDLQALYNRIDRPGVTGAVKSFPWDRYFAALGQPDLQALVVSSVPYFEGFERMLGTVKPAAWQSYLTWHVVRTTAPALPRGFVEEAFAMKSVLTGQREQEPRWKKCVQATHMALPHLVAQPYVARRFGGTSKQATDQMVSAITDAFAGELATLDWMDATTKQRADAKRAAMAHLVGYPATWRTYELTIDRGRFAANALAAAAHEAARKRAKIGKPVDRTDWSFSPAIVNAGYSPLKNQMIFPAGILQPPFFSAQASMTVNLGAIGMVVGHELTHGFDDQGAQFDGAGRMQNWWEPETAAQFKERTACMVEQYAGYEVLPGAHIDGKLTLGENIADAGGVKLAFQAHRALRAQAGEEVVADGFTEDQQFFLAVGQAWCTKARDEQAMVLLKTDPHSPPKYRVIGALTNVPQFAEAFSCPVGSPMRPEKTCEVW